MQMGNPPPPHVSCGWLEPIFSQMSIPGSVFFTYIVYACCPVQIKGSDEKSLHFVKCLLYSPSFSDIIDYIIQIILKNKNRMWGLV